MRHQKKRGKISRNISHRKAMLKNMASSLFLHQRIETTMVKAKALRVFAEPLITLAKREKDPVAAQRLAFRKLSSKEAVQVLFKDLAPLYKEVPGGYTRIIPLGNRKGDGAQVVLMELTKRTISDEELLGTAKKEALKKKKPGKKKPEAKAEEQGAKKVKAHAAPVVDAEEKEEHVVEDVKKEKARKEQKKLTQRGFFKRFRRKSMG